MKVFRFLLVLFSSMFMVSCDAVNDYEENSELYEITDRFVESLQTTYRSYGTFGGLDHTEYTKDRSYKVMPVGRLINVRIERVTKEGEYEELRSELKRHYNGNIHVNDVYICGGGTVMIDCRD